MPSRIIFPKLYKFRKIVEKRRREKLDTTHTVLHRCHSVAEFKVASKILTRRTRRKIEYLTKRQSECGDWFYFRKDIITGTLVKRICSNIKNHSDGSENINKAIAKKHCTKLYYPAILYGIEFEDQAISSFWEYYKKNHRGVVLQKLGLTIHKNNILGGSVDFVFKCACCNNQEFVIGEVKCPFKLKGKSIKENFHELIYLDDSGKLNPNHTYYYQIQTYLGILGLQKAVLVVWSSIDHLEIDVCFNAELWKEIITSSERYFYERYLSTVLEE